MAKSTFSVTSSGMAEIKMRGSKALKVILNDIADDARRVVPKDTGELEESIQVEYVEGALGGSVTVGTDHWAATEYGSEPHIIEANGDYSLHNSETGEYFGRIVNHPGTPEQPFMRPALYKKRVINADEL